MISDLVLCEILLIRVICIAQLAHQGAGDDGLIRESSQLISCYLPAWNVSGRPGSGVRHGLRDALCVLGGKIRKLSSRVIDKDLVLLQASQQRSCALPARENQQILF